MANGIERIPLIGTAFRDQREHYESMFESMTAFQQELLDESKGWASLDAAANEKDVKWSDYVQNHKDCWEAYVENPLAKGYIDRLCDFVVKDGFQLVSEDEGVQDALQRYTKSFDWLGFQRQACRESGIYGELFNRFYEGNASYDSALVDPSIVAFVRTDPSNASKVESYYLKYTVPGYDDEGNQNKGTQVKETVKADEIIHLKVNTVSTATRGISDLLCNLKWLKRHKQVATNLVRRSNAQMSIIGEKIISGPGLAATTAGGYTKSGDESTSSETGKRIERTPAPGTWYVHSPSVQYKFTPIPNDMRGMTDLLKMLNKIICSGFGLSEHWLGDTSESNLATAASLELPILAKFSARQEELKWFFAEHLKKVLALEGLEDVEFDVIPPELSDKDAVEFANAIKTLAEGVILLLDKDLLSRENAAKTVGDYLDNFDSFDEEDEKMKAEKAARQEEAPELQITGPPVPPELMASLQEADGKLMRAGMDELIKDYGKDIADAFKQARKRVMDGLKK